MARGREEGAGLMSFLLMVLMALVCLFEKYPAPPWGGTPALAAALTGLLVLAVAAHAFWLSRRVSWTLQRDPSLRDRVLARYDRARFFHQIGQLVAFAVALCVLGWGWAVRQTWTGHGVELLLLTPFLAGQVLSWACFYDADRASHRAAHRLLDGEAFAQTWLEARQAAAVPFDGRWAYITFQLRQKLALVFIPVLMIIAQKELFRLLPSSLQQWQGLVNLLGVGALFGVFIGMPWVIRVILGLRPLPDGPLRNRLTAAARRLGFRCCDVLLWNTRSGMANALVIGLVPWLRYVVFTDRLLEEFTEDEVEAVFGHEVGHVRHQHMLYYLAFLVLSMGVLGLLASHYLIPGLRLTGETLAAAAPDAVAPTLRAAFTFNDETAIVPIVPVLLAYIFVVFGFLSRRCERQADVYGARAVSCGGDCAGHDETTDLPERAAGLCPTGILTFIRALEKVAVLNGINRERPGFLQSWQHSTIARRVAFLQGLVGDPRREASFQRRLMVVKWGLLLALAAALAALVLTHGWR